MQKNPYDQFDGPAVPAGMPAGSVMIAPPPAANVYDAPQAAATLNKTNQQITLDAAAEQRARAQAARQQQEFVAGLYAKGLRMGANGQPEPIPGWVDPTKAADGTGKPDLAAVRAEAIDKIRLARTLQQRSRDGWFTTGAGANVARFIGGSPAYDVAQDTETLKNAGALTRIMEMAKTNGGKNPLTPLSNSDFQALASSLSNLETGQSDGQFQTNVQRVIDMYSRAYQGAGGTDLEGDIDPAKRRNAATASGSPVEASLQPLTVNNAVDIAAGLAGGTYAFNDQRELTYNGKPVDASADVINSDPYREAFNKRFGEYPSITVDVVGGQPATPTELEKRRDTFGGGVDAAVRGAADMASLGLADPLAAAVRSAFNDDGFDTNLGRERAISRADEEVNPYWRVGGQLAGAIPTMTGLAKAGAALTPTRPFLGTAVADTAGGAVYGGMSNMEKDPVTGALVGGGAALIGNQVGQRVIAPAVESLLARGASQVSPVARALASNTKPAQITNARTAITDALKLKLPMALADADPQLRTIAGSATRISPAARETAERLLEPRGRGQAERAVAGIERDFGPVVNIDETGDALINKGRAAAGGLYDEAYAAPVVATPELDAILSTPAGRQALSRARTIAANERRDPTALGFALDGEGNVVLNPVRLDPYQTQAEAKSAFDAAQEAHKAAMRTVGGKTESTRESLLAARDQLRTADATLAAAPTPGTAATSRGYTTKTLDYVKRGLDDILEQNRDPVTRRLHLDEAGRAVNDVRASLVREVDKLNPRYAQARAAYEGPAKEREALLAGRGAVGPQTTPDRLGRMTAGRTDGQLDQLRTGYRSGMAEQVDRMRFSGNPYDAVYGTPDQVAKVGALFPEAAPNFARQAELERQMGKTQYETLGGSPTAGRAAADRQFGPGLGMQLAGETALGVMTGAPPIGALTTAARATFRDKRLLGAVGRRQADSIAELLLNPVPASALSAIDDITVARILAAQAKSIGGSVGAVTTLPLIGVE